ncbi:MAG: hypothetical protein QW046_01585 [Candidatus Micrarchaeaceae archaeon]
MHILTPEPKNISLVARFILNNFAVIPTDTLYALSISAFAPNAKRIYDIKSRAPC